MTYEYTIQKTKFSGWKAETIIPLGATEHDGKPAQRVLKFTTQKNSRGIAETLASVSKIVPSNGYSMEVSAIFQDYFKSVIRHSLVTRSTEKTITNAHKEAMEFFDKHIQAATAQYGV